jgi:hypothetical protein
MTTSISSESSTLGMGDWKKSLFHQLCSWRSEETYGWGPWWGTKISPCPCQNWERGRTRNMLDIIPYPRTSVTGNISHSRYFIIASHENRLFPTSRGWNVIEPLFCHPFVVDFIDFFVYLGRCSGCFREKTGCSCSIKFFCYITS